ncbi:MAG: uracil-DNA glycosylase [Campylobacterota bacterium]|nr:uracil-DNA glycosylase [Campylobacterota bacterium]
MKRIDCRRCFYFSVTWQPKHPYACKAYGFKGPNMPSVTVKRSSGMDCKMFTPKV